MNDSHNADYDAGTEMTSKRLGENLRRAIKASGLTQAEVAERCEMDPTALSKALAGVRKISSLELALICTATGSDVLGVLDAEPIHGPSYRAGIEEAECRVGIVKPDADGDFTGCGTSSDPFRRFYCDLPHGHEGPHHAHVFWPRDTTVITPVVGQSDG